MDLYSIVFSPTRTSAGIADAVAKGISDIVGCDVTKCDVTYGSQAHDGFRRDDFAVIAAPVYGGKMAPIAKERMKNFSADSTPCILIAVYGNRAFENALNDMSEFVKSLGFVPVAVGAFVGEHSYSTHVAPIASGRPDVKDIEDAMALGNAMGEKIKTRSLTEVDADALHDQPSPQQSLINFRNFVAAYVQQQKEAPRMILPEIDPNLCNGCGQCVDVCPTGAIVEPVGSVDASRCIKCCACVKICPSDARTLSSPFAPVLSANFNSRKQPVWYIGE